MLLHHHTLVTGTPESGSYEDAPEIAYQIAATVAINFCYSQQAFFFFFQQAFLNSQPNIQHLQI